MAQSITEKFRNNFTIEEQDNLRFLISLTEKDERTPSQIAWLTSLEELRDERLAEVRKQSKL